jgi:hypothetical protein
VVTLREPLVESWSCISRTKACDANEIETKTICVRFDTLDQTSNCGCHSQVTAGQPSARTALHRRLGGWRGDPRRPCAFATACTSLKGREEKEEPATSVAGEIARPL